MPAGIPGRKFSIPGHCQIPLYRSLLLFPDEKLSKLFPGENFKVRRGTWPGCLIEVEPEAAHAQHPFCINMKSKLHF